MEMNPARVVVAVLNWNGLGHLQRYLPGVVHSSKGAARVAVIDNGSTDASVAWVRSEFPEVEVVQLSVNAGFAGGYNAGLAGLDAEVFVLLNSDVRTEGDWIRPVLETMEREQFSACQPLIRNDTDPELFEYAGAAGGFMDRDGFMFCAGRIFEVFESDEGQYAQDREVFWASGAALFVRADAWRSVGGLDEDFFAHMEEIDLCWRLKNRGHRVGVCGSSAVFHLGGGTLQKISPFKTYLNFRNNLFLLLKNHHMRPWPFVLLRRMALDGIAAWKFLLEGSPRLFLAVFHAHVGFYRKSGKMFRKRIAENRAMESANTPPNAAGWYRRSILIDYFFRGRVTFDSLPKDAFVKS
jgi:GT2 family glycosyltransferase